MRAYVLHDIHNICMEEVEVPEIGSKEVLVEVMAAGICGSDIPRIYRTGTYSYPLIAGHEFSGKVVAVGGEVDAAWKEKRVGIFPLIPCMQCPSCKEQKYELCKHYNYLGSRTNGGFAEYVAVPEWNLIALPDTVSFEEAAMLEPMAVAVHAMRQLQPHKTDTVAVYGLGTIGILLTMFLKEMGIDGVLCIGNKEIQRQAIEGLGIPALQYCDSHLADVNQWVMERTENRGADLFFECVGTNETIKKTILNTAPEGKILMVGNPESDMCFDRNLYWKILRNQLTIKGTWNSSFTHSAADDWHYVIEKLEKQSIKPESLITHRLAFEQLEKGLLLMRDKTERYIKVMITK